MKGERKKERKEGIRKEEREWRKEERGERR
jgi:hypothetical protein